MNRFTAFQKEYEAALRTRTLGHALEVHETLDSTNTYLKRRLAEDGVPEGLSAVALMQTAGRGRLGRTWESVPGAGLYLSFATQPLPGTLLPLVPLAVGVAVARACRDTAGVEAGIKWPNDVIVRDHKLCGILCEGVHGRAVCGIGVNLLQTASFFERAGLPHATSLFLETGAAPDAAGLAAGIANTLEPLLDGLLEDRGAALIPLFRTLCVSIGREVRAVSPHGELIGRAVDVDAEGRLVMETQQGRTAVSAGEVQLRTARGYL